MKVKVAALLSVAFMLSTVVYAQMHGGGGNAGGMNGTHSGMSSMPGTMSPNGMGPMGPNQNMSTMTPGQRRHLMHTTTAQDQQYAKCAQKMTSVQHDINNMMHGVTGSTATSSTSDDSNNSDMADALANDMQDLSQDDNDLVAGLNDDQNAALTAQLKSLEKNTKEMQALTDRLKTEMATQGTDSRVIHEDLKKLDKLAKKVSKQQHEIADALGIET